MTVCVTQLSTTNTEGTFGVQLKTQGDTAEGIFISVRQWLKYKNYQNISKQMYKIIQIRYNGYKTTILANEPSL